MVDASDAARFHEARKLLFDAAGHDYVRGKPLLVVANKQDCMQAVSAQEVAEALRIHDVGGSAQGAVNTRSCHVTTASLQDSCAISSGSTLDAGLIWLVGRIQAEYIELQSRVSQDEAEQQARVWGRRKGPTVTPEPNNVVSDGQHDVGACGEGASYSVSSSQPVPPGRSCSSH